MADAPPKKGWSGAKVLLVLAGFVTLVVMGGLGAGYLWFRANADRLREMGAKTEQEAEAFGKGKTRSACLKQGLERFKASAGMIEEVRAKLFTTRCMKVADASAEPDFCKGVPPKDEIIASATWAIERCESLGMADSQPCTRWVQAIQEHCGGQD